ncbi:MAG: 50S ribosomal protein L3 [Helicobacteraceae bacterium]|nr:50S ribosomal protein L3 [Helicobacteraceae bacterium]
MEYIVEKIGMSRTLTNPSFVVTLLQVRAAKVLEADADRALIAYANGKRHNRTIGGNQKKYGLSKEFNRFATVSAKGVAVGDQDYSLLKEGLIVKSVFLTKGRGFTGLIKRWNFQGGPGAHGSRFHRTSGSIGNREEPGRVFKGKKMAGHYGVETVSVKSRIYSFDPENRIVVVKGSVPGAKGALGRIKVAQ